MENKFKQFFTKAPNLFFKIGMPILLIATVINLIGILADPSVEFLIRVKPVEMTDTIKSKAFSYTKADVAFSGTLKIKSPDFIDKVLMKPDYAISFIDSIFYFLGLLILLFMVRKINNKTNIFLVDISKDIALFGFLLVLFYLCNGLRDKFIQTKVLSLTKGAFAKDFISSHWVQLWSGIILMSWSALFKRGHKLQQEQDLTV